MADKQINHEQSSVIIDGIDVSRCTCRYYAYNRHLCSLIGDDLCEEHSDCLYKQLKRKEKSEEKLVNQIKTICDFINNRPETFKGINGSVDKIITDYAERKEQECEELKEQLKVMNEVIRTETTRCSLVNSLKTELDQLKAENDELKKQHQADKGLITSTGKQNYQLLQEYDKLKTENDELRQFLSKEPLAIQALQKSYESYQKSTKVFSDWVDDYKKLIIEIREICKTGIVHGLSADEYATSLNVLKFEILQKISEVEDDR